LIPHTAFFAVLRNESRQSGQGLASNLDRTGVAHTSFLDAWAGGTGKLFAGNSLQGAPSKPLLLGRGFSEDLPRSSGGEGGSGGGIAYAVERFFVRVDVTDNHSFLANRLSPYQDR
jgi:hypothetical protein